jgi:putative toxin-antitoxin system antitoxin component (TIGR02293 family)
MKSYKKVSFEDQINQEVSSMFASSIASEPSAPYGSLTYPDFLSNKMLLIQAIRKGIPQSFFELIQQFTPFTENDWANLLDVSSKSLQRYKNSDHLYKPIHSEKIIEMAEVTQLGVDVFGEMPKFKLWLDTPCYALGNHKPMDLLRDSYGKEMVMAELTRINYGILS